MNAVLSLAFNWGPTNMKCIKKQATEQKVVALGASTGFVISFRDFP